MVVKFLQLTKERIVTGGWCQGIYGDVRGSGPVCLSGAMHSVYPIYDDLRHTATNLLLELLPKHCGIVTFNDATTTTKEDVLKLIDKAILKAEEES